MDQIHLHSNGNSEGVGFQKHYADSLEKEAFCMKYQYC